MSLVDPQAFAREAQAELDRRARVRKLPAEVIAEVRSRLWRKLSPKQLAFVQDRSRFVINVGSRQSGKGESLIAIALECMLSKAGALVYYVAPTLKQARENIWERFKETALTFGFTLDSFNESRCEATAPNGSILRLAGAPTIRDAEAILGKVCDLIMVDEVSIYPEHILRHLVMKVSFPALGVRQGRLVMAGTPGFMPEGWLYKLCTSNPQTSKHSLQVADNPAYADSEAWLAEYRSLNGLEESDPVFQREFRGRWVPDGTSQVWKIGETIDAAPRCDNHIIGVDFGAGKIELSDGVHQADPTAIVVIGWNDHSDVVYEVLSEEHDGWDSIDICDRLKILEEKYHPLVIVGDGASLQTLGQLQRRHQINIQPAEKGPGYKIDAFKIGNAALKRGKLQIITGSALALEMRTLQWDPKFPGVKEKPRGPGSSNHASDALLYSWLRCPAHREEALPPPPPPLHSAEWWAERSRQDREDVLAQADTHTRTERNFMNALTGHDE